VKPTGQYREEWNPDLFNLLEKDAMEKQTLNHRKDRYNRGIANISDKTPFKQTWLFFYFLEFLS
jgi:hypothetical protein